MLQKSRKRNITIQEVADEAGVSRMTVYRALKGSGSVKDKTVLKIKKAFRETEKPAVSKPEIAIHCSRRFYSCSETSEDFYQPLSNNIQRYFQIENLDCFLLDCSALLEKEEKRLKECRLLVLCGPFSKEEYAKTKSLNPEIKIISVLGADYYKDIYYVRGDDFSGGVRAAEIMLKYKHKHTAVLGSIEAYDRMIRNAGFSSKMQAAGVSVEFIECPPESPFECKVKSFENLLAKSPAITGVFILCGQNAVIFKNYLAGKGLTSPEDIGIVTFDNLSIYNMLGMDFTKIYFVLDDIAFTTVKVSLNIIKSALPDKVQVLVPIKVEKGNSITSIKQMRKR